VFLLFLGPAGRQILDARPQVVHLLGKLLDDLPATVPLTLFVEGLHDLGRPNALGERLLG
jgi:hypothetical protein